MKKCYVPVLVMSDADLIGFGWVFNPAELELMDETIGDWVPEIETPHSGRIFRTDSGQSQIILSGLNMVGGLHVFSTFST